MIAAIIAAFLMGVEETKIEDKKSDSYHAL